MVLLVIDTQKGLVNQELFLYESFVDNIKKLIYEARKNNLDVIYVIHDDGVGSNLTRGKKEFEIFEEFKPLSSEKIFIKNANSAFKNTGLLEYLEKRKQKEIIVVGLQTDKCINATVISGFEHGLKIIVPAYANSTIDNDYMESEMSYKYFNDFMWQGRYAKCLSIEETIKRMENHKIMRDYCSP